MRAIVDHSALRAALQLCSGAVQKRNIIPILASVRIEAKGDAILLAATDLETTIMTSVDAAVRSDGAFTVDMAALLDVVKSVDDGLALTAASGKLDISSGASKFQLFTRPIDDFPILPHLTEAESITLSASTLLPMVRTCSYPMTSEEKRAQLNGELFAMTKRTLSVVACDMHRIAVTEADVKTGMDLDLFVPANLVKGSEKLSASPDGFDVTLSWNDSHVAMRLGRDSVIAKRPEVKFPQWRESVPVSNGPRRLIVDTARFARAVRAVAPFSTHVGGRNALKFDLTRGRLGMSSASSERGSASSEITIDYSGDDWTRGYDAVYVNEAISAIATAKTELAFEDNGALVFRPHDSKAPYSALHLTMDMRTL